MCQNLHTGMVISYDHMAIHIPLNVSKPARLTRTIFLRNIRAIYPNCLADDNREIAILRHPATELDPMVCQYNSTLSTLPDKHAPPKSKTFPVRMRLRRQNNSVGNLKASGDGLV